MRLRVSSRLLLSVGCVLVAAPARAQPGPGSPPPRTYTYKTAAGCEIKADVYRLPGEDTRPAILWLHGGALIFGDRGSVKEHQLERYLRAGYVVVSADYRLAPETKLPEIVQDLKDAYAWMREKGPGLFQIDPERIAVMGNSAGGYLTLMAGFCLTPRPKALVSFYGYGDITGAWTTRPSPEYAKWEPVAKQEAYAAIGTAALSESPPYPRVEFYNYCRQHGLWLAEVAGIAGSDPEVQSAEARDYRPVLHVTRDFPPTLLLHGTDDIDVPFEQSKRMAEALDQRQVEHQLIALAGYDHLFNVYPEGFPPQGPPAELKDPKVLAALDQVTAFLGKHLTKR